MSLNDLCPRPRWISTLDDGDEPHVDSDQGYRLAVIGGVATIEGVGAGLFYAEATLAQMHQLHPDGVADVVIVDEPAIALRGVMLDVSRGKVPTLATLELLIERLASLKVNVVQLYLEHTFAHPGHETAWEHADAYTAADIGRLQAFAARHHVQLVGQQNALGHLERWLEHPRYAPLAARPGGYRSPSGGHEPAACVDPADDAAFDLVAELVTNVAEAFDSPMVHVGLDEPIDLHPAVWDAIFDVPGAPVPWAHVDNGAFCVPLDEPRRSQYMAWIERLRALPALDGREMLMWADVMAPHPELLDELPDGVTLVEWGYEGSHPFDARCGRIAAAGRPFWVAPGTSSWSSMSGRIAAMSDNVSGAVAAAVRHGANGLIVCDWGDDGHHQYLPISWPGFVAAAAAAWNPDVAVDLRSALAAFVCGDEHLADATWRLGHANDVITPSVPEAGTLAALLTSASAPELLAAGGMTPAMLDAADDELLACIASAEAAASDEPDGALWADEIAAAASWLRLAVSVARTRLGWTGAWSAVDVASEHARLLTEHERLWRARNRESELERSLVGIRSVIDAKAGV